MPAPTVTALLNKLKLYNKVPDNNKDTLFTEFILASVEICEKYCNQPLFQKTVTLYIEVTKDQGFIYLPFSTDVTLNSVHELEDEFDSGLTFDSDNYLKQPDGALTKFIFRNANTTKLYKLSVTVGYAHDGFPSDLNKVVMEMSTIMYKESPDGDSRLGIMTQSKSVGAGSLTTTYSDLAGRFKYLLAPWRIPAGVKP
jgi:hypothetical protein